MGEGEERLKIQEKEEEKEERETDREKVGERKVLVTR